MSFDSVDWVLRQLASFYHSIYFYVTLFSLSYCLVVYKARERIYQMELTWGRISLVYCCAGCLAAMGTLVAYYVWVSGRLLWKQYWMHNVAKRRARILFELYRRQEVAAQKKKQAKGVGGSSN